MHQDGQVPRLPSVKQHPNTLKGFTIMDITAKVKMLTDENKDLFIDYLRSLVSLQENRGKNVPAVSAHPTGENT